MRREGGRGSRLAVALEGGREASGNGLPGRLLFGDRFSVFGTPVPWMQRRRRGIIPAPVFDTGLGFALVGCGRDGVFPMRCGIFAVDGGEPAPFVQPFVGNS